MLFSTCNNDITLFIRSVIIIHTSRRYLYRVTFIIPDKEKKNRTRFNIGKRLVSRFSPRENILFTAYACQQLNKRPAAGRYSSAVASSSCCINTVAAVRLAHAPVHPNESDPTSDQSRRRRNRNDVIQTRCGGASCASLFHDSLSFFEIISHVIICLRVPPPRPRNTAIPPSACKRHILKFATFRRPGRDRKCRLQRPCRASVAFSPTWRRAPDGTAPSGLGIRSLSGFKRLDGVIVDGCYERSLAGAGFGFRGTVEQVVEVANKYKPLLELSSKQMTSHSKNS